MPDKKEYANLNTLQVFLDNLKNLFATKTEIDETFNEKADIEHAHTLDDIDGLQAEFDNIMSEIDSVETSLSTPAGDGLGMVMSGGNVSIQDGIITVLDDSHDHIIDNITGLQDVLDTKSEISHTHDDLYYTESEIDTKISGINSTIEDVVNGDIIVAKASHAVTADSSTSSVSAENASKDSDGNVITIHTKQKLMLKLN